MVADRKVVLDTSAMLASVLHENGANAVDRMLPIAVLPVTALATVLAMGVIVEPAKEPDADRAAALIVESRRKATPRHSPSATDSASPPRNGSGCPSPAATCAGRPST